MRSFKNLITFGVVTTLMFGPFAPIAWIAVLVSRLNADD